MVTITSQVMIELEKLHKYDPNKNRPMFVFEQVHVYVYMHSDLLHNPTLRKLCSAILRLG